MPALITHDFFGRDVYEGFSGVIGSTRTAREAFLLGNQGPDPFFYSVLDPTLVSCNRIGSTMHREKPAELLAAVRESLCVLTEPEREAGLAYALGFLCHYLLDSTVHPLVYSQQYALCDAGEPGLTRKDGSEVHAVIESEFDEMLLYTRRGLTVADFRPQREILRASEQTLGIISRMHGYAALKVYGSYLPRNMYRRSVHCFRFVQGVFHSRTGRKRAVLMRAEQVFRRYSFVAAMSHRPVELAESAFENRARRPWTDPFTGKARSESFSDLYARALSRAAIALPAFADEGFGLAEAGEIARGLNFSGDPGRQAQGKA